MKYEDLGAEVGKLVDEKNAAYGNSFNVVEDFIKLLWPNGVPPEAFNDMLCVVRIFDKLKRIATNKGYGGESPYRDIAGYALLGLMKDQDKQLNTYEETEEDRIWNKIIFGHKCDKDYYTHMKEMCKCGHIRVVHEFIDFEKSVLNKKYDCTQPDCNCNMFDEKQVVSEKKKNNRKKS